MTVNLLPTNAMFGEVPCIFDMSLVTMSIKVCVLVCVSVCISAAVCNVDLLYYSCINEAKMCLNV